MSTYNSYKTDSKMEKEGILLDFGSAGKIRIARAGGSNERYKRKLSEASRPYRAAIASGTLDEKTSDIILFTVYAQTIVLGWEGITDENGKALALEEANVIKLFTDLPDLFAQVKKAAEDSALFRQLSNEADAKN